MANLFVSPCHHVANLWTNYSFHPATSWWICELIFLSCPQVGQAAGGDVSAHDPAGAAVRVHGLRRSGRLGLLPPLQVPYHQREVTKRCRLSLLTNSALVIRGKGGSCGVSANEYSCAHHVTWRPNKLWRPISIFNLCVPPMRIQEG